MNEIEFKLMKNNMDEFQYYLYFYRKRLGLSQAKLAKELNMSLENIRLYELGEKVPNEKLINKIYNGLNKYIKENVKHIEMRCS